MGKTPFPFTLHPSLVPATLLHSSSFDPLFSNNKPNQSDAQQTNQIPHLPNRRTSRLLLATNSLARLPLGCTLRRSIRITLARYRIQLATLITLFAVLTYLRLEILARRDSRARVPALVATTLDRLATQAVLHARGDAAEEWISVGQLRDDILRDEFSAKRREDIWKQVKAVVEMNANVRASVREGRGGEISRVWEWIGSLGVLGEEAWSGERKSGAGRVSYGSSGLVDNGFVGSSLVEGGARGEMVVQRKWDEGRPIY